MKTWSLMTLHALIIYLAIRMPATNGNKIRRLKFASRRLPAARAPCWEPHAARRTNKAQACRGRGVKVCKSVRSLKRGALK